jgi:hypothetical protein
LAGFVAGAATPGLVGMILAFLSGASPVGFVVLAATYAATIIAVANAWLYHRLVCLDEYDGGPGPLCAIGTVQTVPEVGDLGQFDNDQYFHLRLMPHRQLDAYMTSVTDGLPAGDKRWQWYPENELYADQFQGQQLLRPSIPDLPYDRQKSEASYLHCEAEGNFWQAMKDYAAIAGIAVGVGAALGAAAGCAIGFALGGFLGCILGAIFGGALGGGAAAYASAQIAFHSDPGDVEDANVGDRALGPIQSGDQVVLVGKHVYDGFHEGWHEFHPLMAIMKIHDQDSSQYLEWNPDFTAAMAVPADDPAMPPAIQHLDWRDMASGLSHATFRDRAYWLRDRWCNAVLEAFAGATRDAQQQPQHRWTIHPDVDGCVPAPPPPPPPAGGIR